jgi:mitochondrial distribution and morphology protein 10
VLSSISVRRRRAQEASIPIHYTNPELIISSVSTGIRFTTLPDATPPSFQLPGNSSSPLSMVSPRGPPSPPTTITALFNPMMGHMSGAYAARVSRDLALCSRFDFNVYSYESEWTMGAEYWMRRTPSKLSSDDDESQPPTIANSWEDVHGVVKARASTNSVWLILSNL